MAGRVLGLSVSCIVAVSVTTDGESAGGGGSGDVGHCQPLGICGSEVVSIDGLLFVASSSLTTAALLGAVSGATNIAEAGGEPGLCTDTAGKLGPGGGICMLGNGDRDGPNDRDRCCGCIIVPGFGMSCDAFCSGSLCNGSKVHPSGMVIPAGRFVLPEGIFVEVLGVLKAVTCVVNVLCI